MDIVTLAAGWGCKVVQLGELLAELKKLKPLPRKDESQVCVCVHTCICVCVEMVDHSQLVWSLLLSLFVEGDTWRTTSKR